MWLPAFFNHLVIAMFRQTKASISRAKFVLALVALFSVCRVEPTSAQTGVVIQTTDGQVITTGGSIPLEAMHAMQAKAAAQAASESSDSKSGEKPKGDDEGKKKEGGKDENKKDKKSDDGKTVKRPPKPTFAPNPEELTVKPDADGRIRFNFHGQSWPDVLHWLAGVSGMSLDWQELPSDFLNLTTQRSYDLAEARDLLNRHLLSRGFTMLEQGEVLMVVNLKKLDPSLVPRIGPDDLEDHPPHAFAKFRSICQTV